MERKEGTENGPEQKLYVVGTGPGAYEHMTVKAVQVLGGSDVLVGYGVYIELVKPYFPHKEYITTPMMQEVERCRTALSKAAEGFRVSLICSGDAGVYGMAGPVLELAPEFPQVEIEIVPGVTAALSGAAVLGAPIGHDFAVISLSDLLTPLELIEKRLVCAAESDMIICLYNPASKKRKDYLYQACQIVGRYRKPETVCGLVQHIGRQGQTARLLTLKALEKTQVDMFTTVYIGNSRTKLECGRMVSPRGYRDV